MLRSLLNALCARAPFLGLFIELLVVSGSRLRATEWLPRQEGAGTLTVHHGLPIACLTGDAAAIGTAEGHLFGPRIPQLLGLMGIQPQLLLARYREQFALTVAAIPAPVRSRLSAVAAASGADFEKLLAANALVDAQCSALVALPQVGEPLRVARSMDFFPAKILGPGTVLSIIRETGCRPYASIGWPGSAAVISGMNDAGVVACILLNHAGSALPGGEPVALRVAEILGHAATVAEAVTCFAARPVASSHYVLLADAHTATIVWLDRDGMHRDLPTGDWLVASNGGRRSGLPVDERGRALIALACGTPTAERMRQTLSASYMPAINAQAMVFEPATLTLTLALGTGMHPAAKNGWWRLSLGALFTAGDSAGLIVDQVAASTPLPHYADSVPSVQSAAGQRPR